jgi:hypothetical protein
MRDPTALHRHRKRHYLGIILSGDVGHFHGSGTDTGDPGHPDGGHFVAEKSNP